MSSGVFIGNFYPTTFSFSAFHISIIQPMEILLNIAPINENNNLLNNGQFYGTLFLITLALASIHIWAHHFHGFFKSFESIFASFSGGLASAYVFLHLFPELENAESVLGKSIHVITLLGFIIFYGIKSFILQNSVREEALKNRVFYTEISFLFIYNALIIFTTPESIGAVTSGIMLYLLSMGLHIFISNFELQKKHDRRFYKLGCYILVSSLFFGFIMSFLIDPWLSEAISDMLTAILAGFILFNVFVEELPHPKNSTFLWFAIGIAFYVILLEGKVT